MRYVPLYELIEGGALTQGSLTHGKLRQVPRQAQLTSSTFQHQLSDSNANTDYLSRVKVVNELFKSCQGNFNTMGPGNFLLFGSCLMAALQLGQCGTVLSILIPGPMSHLFGMKKVSEAVAARGHTVKVRHVAPADSRERGDRIRSSSCTLRSAPSPKELLYCAIRRLRRLHKT